MTLYKVGQRVATQYGDGVIIGFESFVESTGLSAPHALYDNGEARIVVCLVNPMNFLTGVYGDPHFCRSDKIEGL